MQNKPDWHKYTYTKSQNHSIPPFIWKITISDIKASLLNWDLITTIFLNGKLLWYFTVLQTICIQLTDNKYHELSRSYKYIGSTFYNRGVICLQSEVIWFYFT